MNRTYELMFIVRPDMTDEDLDKLISTLQSVVPPSGGTVIRVDKMGKRRLAYTVRRFHDGIYVLMVIEGGGPVMHELERRLRVTEPVIKFLTVRVDEEQKRLDKIKKLRDAKKKVSAQPAASRAGRTCGSSGYGDSSDRVKTKGQGSGLGIRVQTSCDERSFRWPLNPDPWPLFGEVAEIPKESTSYGRRDESTRASSGTEREAAK